MFHTFKEYFPNGYLGVDIFFVISGFVIFPQIQQILKSKNIYSIELRAFYQRRFYRLAPALIVLIIFSGILSALLDESSNLKRFSIIAISSFIGLSNFILYYFNTDYFSQTLYPLTHTWSLSVEIQIYFILPLILTLIFWKINLKRFWFVIWIFSILSLSQNWFKFLQDFFQINYIDEFSFYSTFDRIWQFSLGGIIQAINLTMFRRKIFQKLILGLLILILFTSYGISKEIDNIIICILAAFIIKIRILNIFPKNIFKILGDIGDRSYSIYLYHLPILYFLRESIIMSQDYTIVQDNYVVKSLFVNCLTIFLSFIFGSISYNLIEKRFSVKNKTFYFGNLKKILWLYCFSFFILINLFFMGRNDLIRDPKFPIPSHVAPWNFDPNCNSLNYQNRKNYFCTYPAKDNQGKKMLLIGDSHAASMSKSIKELGNARGFNVYVQTRSRCRFYLEFSNKEIDLPNVDEKCMDHNKQIYDLARELKFDVIFYSQEVAIDDTNLDSLVELENTNQLIFKSLNQLSSKTKRLFFIGQTPVYLSNSSLVSKLFEKPGSFSKLPNIDNTYWINKLASGRIDYINVMPLFCRKQSDCINRINGEWLFHDKDHLSLEGSEYIMPYIENALNKF